MSLRTLFYATCAIGLAGCDVQPTETAASEDGVPVYDQELVVSFTEADLWALYEPACLSQGMDPDLCRCIMAAVIDAAGVNAAAWLASDMSLMEDQAAKLLTHIGYEQATSAGDAFDAAQNGECNNTELEEQADGTTGSASGSLAAVASEDTAIDKTTDE